MGFVSAEWTTMTSLHWAHLLSLMLMQGIQDGTLPADVETAALEAASSSAARLPAGAPGGTSLDRLVLNQLVTVLQATSTLTGGASRQAGAAAGPDS